VILENDADFERIFCSRGNQCSELSMEVCQLVDGQKVNKCETTPLTLSALPPSAFRVSQTVSGMVNVDLGYTPISPVVLKVYDIKGNLLATEYMNSRFASIKLNAGNGIYLFKAGNRSVVKVFAN
jgi:hypothetical protein